VKKIEAGGFERLWEYERVLSDAYSTIVVIKETDKNLIPFLKKKDKTFEGYERWHKEHIEEILKKCGLEEGVEIAVIKFIVGSGLFCDIFKGHQVDYKEFSELKRLMLLMEEKRIEEGKAEENLPGKFEWFLATIIPSKNRGVNERITEHNEVLYEARKLGLEYVLEMERLIELFNIPKKGKEWEGLVEMRKAIEKILPIDERERIKNARFNKKFGSEEFPNFSLGEGLEAIKGFDKKILGNPSIKDIVIQADKA